MLKNWGAGRVLVEDKGTGISLVQELRRQILQELLKFRELEGDKK